MSKHHRISDVVSGELLEAVQGQFCLDWHGLHGYPHWLRVWENGVRLSELSGMRSPVIELFAFLHDACRQNDGSDPAHGSRAAKYAQDLRKAGMIAVTEDEAALLSYALSWHARHLLEAVPIVQICWDSDRLDLGRAGIRPHPDRLCTQFARQPEVIDWAYQRSISKL